MIGLGVKLGSSTPAVISSVVGTVIGSWNGIGAVGGDTITITGTGFVNGASLAFTANGIACTSVTFISSTSCTCITPGQTGVASPSSSYTFTGTNGNGTAMNNSTITYQWDPSQLPSLFWWSRADRNVQLDGNGYVNNWGILAGTCTTGPMTQNIATHRPGITNSWTNSRAALTNLNNSPQTSTAVDLFMGITGGANPATSTIIGQWNSSFGVGNPIMSCGDSSFFQTDIYILRLDIYNGTEITSTSHPAFTSPFWTDSIFDVTSGAGYFNGSSIVTGATGAHAPTRLNVFNFDSINAGFGGYIAEFIVDNQVRDATHLGYVNTYVHAYYGI